MQFDVGTTGNNYNAHSFYTVYRSIGGGSYSAIGQGTGGGSYNYGAGSYAANNYYHAVGHCFLDSPNTTSEVTYIVKWRVQRSATYIYLNRCGTDGDDVGNHRNSSSITLMEIAP